MRTGFFAFSALLVIAVQANAAQKPPAPSNGPKATVIRNTNLYVAPDTSSSRLAEISPGRDGDRGEKRPLAARVRQHRRGDLAIAGYPGVWSRSGRRPGIRMDVGSRRSELGDPQGRFDSVRRRREPGERCHVSTGAPERCPGSAFLYQRMSDFFPQSPLAPEAAWRSADIRWQLQKVDISSLPSAHEKDAYLRDQIDDEEFRKLKKAYPRSKWADLADWDMMDNKVCGDWQGSTKCPQKEAEMYEKYAQEHPDSPRAAEALYNAVYRQGALNDIYSANGDDKKAGEAKARAITIAGTIAAKYPQSDYAARAASLVYQLQESIPIYGVDRQ